MSWYYRNTVLMYTSDDFQYKPNIGCFGLKNTICKNIDNKNWDLWNPNILEKFRLINEKGGSIVFISDQSDIDLNALKAKFCRFVKKLTIDDKSVAGETPKYIPIMALFAMKKNCYRKPFTNLWNILLIVYKKEKKAPPDIKSSIYVGGRDGGIFLSNWKEVKQNRNVVKNFKNRSDNDRAFANNVGLQFSSAKAFFMDKPSCNWKWNNFLMLPKKRIEYYKTHKNDEEPDIMEIIEKMGGEKHLIIINGNYSSGKSTLAKRILDSFKEKNGENFKITILSDYKIRFTKKNIKLFTDSIFESTTIIKTYKPTYEARKRYIKLAKKYEIPVLIINLTTPSNICRILNHTKVQLSNDIDLNIHPFNFYNKWITNFEYPDYIEEFIEVIDYPMVLRYRKALMLNYSPF